MLDASNRLRTAADFRQAVRRGRRAGGRLLVVHLDPANVDKATSRSLRVGFVVAKSVGPAVSRNRVRRRLRHLVRERIAGLPADGLLVVRALPESAAASYQELGSELDHCLGRVVAS
ncbi:MAG TPA: ribonuclease P protein component [Marmoricola sp.]